MLSDDFFDGLYGPWHQRDTEVVGMHGLPIIDVSDATWDKPQAERLAKIFAVSYAALRILDRMVSKHRAARLQPWQFEDLIAEAELCLLRADTAARD